jgi:hypothetical protein
MKPRPFYRWKSFWLGVLTLGFLCWAWVRAMSHCDTMKVYLGETCWYIESWGPHFEIERNPLFYSHGWLPGVSIDSDEADRNEPRWFPPAIERFNRGLRIRQEMEQASDNPDPLQDAAERKELIAQQIEISDFMTWRFAWWFAMVIFLVPWALFLTWRWRRMKTTASSASV